jgi:hypothetical protein
MLFADAPWSGSRWKPYNSTASWLRILKHSPAERIFVGENPTLASKLKKVIYIMKLVPLDEFGDLIPINEFFDAVKHDFFIDYDGVGHWATEKEMDKDEEVYPSKVVKDGYVKPEWATHVIWYNQ